MKNILILGAGSAGTMMANHLNKKLDKSEWDITIVDQFTTHYYQPGFLFIPFGIYEEKDVIKKKSKFIPSRVNLIQKRIELIKPEENTVLIEDDVTLNYDILIVATGCKIVPEEVDGLTGDGWRKNIFDFYTIEGAKALAEKLKTWEGGKFVLNLAEMPIKCPVAPLEFLFLADSYFTKKGIRDKVEISYVTPLDAAFTKPKASKALGQLLVDKNIKIIPDFDIDTVDSQNNKIVSYDEREVEYDLLISIPTNMGDDLIENSGMGDELNFIPTDPYTLQSKAHENIFVLGDATDIEASKAGSVAHFQADILVENIVSYAKGEELHEKFDGHANCFIESGFGKAFLIDFNYDVEPVEGTFPIAGIGPFKLLKETRINHLGKMAFKQLYWSLLLKGLPIPTVKSHMSTKGKKI